MALNLSEARHAFVTGGGAGIGLGIVEVLAARGLAVTVTDINEDALQSAVAERGGKLQPIVLDVRDRAGWARAKSQAEAAFGPVDVLINNAGVSTNGDDLAEIDPAIWDCVIDINLNGVFNGVSTFSADMKARGRGHIVNVSSMLGMGEGRATRGPYAAAKAAVVALSESLRSELAPFGVGVTCLVPGGVKSNVMETARRLVGHPPTAATLPPNSLEPEQAGELVARAIERNAFYLPTHPETILACEMRMEAIRRDFGEESAVRETNPL